MKWSRGLAHANGRYSMQGERLREPHALRENKDHSREADSVQCIGTFLSVWKRYSINTGYMVAQVKRKSNGQTRCRRVIWQLREREGGGGASGRREMQKKDGAKTILNHAGYIVSNHVNYCGSYLNV